LYISAPAGEVFGPRHVRLAAPAYARKTIQMNLTDMLSCHSREQLEYSNLSVLPILAYSDLAY
jgi:hypothetical protein